MLLQVETALEHSAIPQPIHFFLGPKRITVVQIVDRWPSADCTYFKIYADDGNTYILRHDEHIQEWEMTFFQTGYQH